MKKIAIFLFTLSISLSSSQNKKKDVRNKHYVTNQKPLISQPYTALPLGTIKPKGWLLTMLELQRDGLTGHLDSIYDIVCGPDNGWLGGSGDGWERGPYWLDGLVPLAFILDDEELKLKAKQWIDWSIENQRKNGYFGPLPLPEDAPIIPGTQQNMRKDWWPKMVMLKVLQQYYSATEDERVINLMDKYFRYQLEALDEYPLGHWTFWGNRRGGDNLAVVYWLYNITGEKYLLDLAEIIHEQTYNWTEVFSGNIIRTVNPLPDLHCVNVAMGLKEPVIYYQQHPDTKYLIAVKKGLQSLKDVHGFVNGMFGGDEQLHGNNPTQGSEFCTAVEMMFCFESILPITGDTYYADYLEKIAFNVLPAQHDDAFTRRQYFQQANQVMITTDERNFFIEGNGRHVFGVLSGYPCCTANMHQGWPKFVQNLWYATADNGLATLVYGASEVRAKVADGQVVHFVEETGYPFDDNIRLTYKTNENVKFPLHLRIPGWCIKPVIKINGEKHNDKSTNNIIVVEKTWKKGDVVELTFPMEIKFSRWYENSVGIERGPLVYALKLEGKWREIKEDSYLHSYFEITPLHPWNYGLYMQGLVRDSFKFTKQITPNGMPWNLENAPLQMETSAVRMPMWKMYNYSTGPLPSSAWPTRSYEDLDEKITLIPYGCTTLRISQFPVVDKTEHEE